MESYGRHPYTGGPDASASALKPGLRAFTVHDFLPMGPVMKIVVLLVAISLGAVACDEHPTTAPGPSLLASPLDTVIRTYDVTLLHFQKGDVVAFSERT